MASIYCDCGFKTDYSGIKPKTCQACGDPFVKAFVPVKREPAPKQTKAARQHARWEEEEEEDLNEIREILSFDIKSQPEPQEKMTIGSLGKKEAAFDRGMTSQGAAEGVQPIDGFKQELLSNMLKQNSR